MADQNELRATSQKSFEDAAVQAMGQLSGSAPERFTVVSMSIEHGGVVGVPQYTVELRRD